MFILPEILVEKGQVYHHQHAAAGDEAVCYIEYGKVHEGGFEHIHHIAQPQPVDLVAQTAAVDGGDAPALKRNKAQRLFEIFPDEKPGKNQENQGKQPLLPLKGGESGAVGLGKNPPLQLR